MGGDAAYSPTSNNLAYGLRLWLAENPLQIGRRPEVRLAAISAASSMAIVKCFRPCDRTIILRRRGPCDSRQHVTIVPQHPLRRTRLQFLGTPEQLREVIERVDFVPFAGVNQTRGFPCLFQQLPDSIFVFFECSGTRWSQPDNGSAGSRTR